jgi:protein-tyrosine-phosphatase
MMPGIWTTSSSLGGKRLGDFDVIVAMVSRHRDYVLSLCPECWDKVVVWNVKNPYVQNVQKDYNRGLCSDRRMVGVNQR